VPRLIPPITGADKKQIGRGTNGIDR
jgi:hypothetical protein